MTIYGAGVIGCEYATMFRNLDVKLNLVNTRDKLLEFLDDEIIDALSYRMRDTGIRLRHSESFVKVEPREDCVVVCLKSGKQLKSDALLWANGRSGNTETLGLENVGLEADHRGQIPVNPNFQTATPGIYAVGDVIGPPALASAAYIQGRFAARHLGDSDCEDFCMADIPTGIYTTPEISSLGKTEKELTEARVPYEVGHSMFKEPGASTDRRQAGWNAKTTIPQGDSGNPGHPTASAPALPRSSTLARQSCQCLHHTTRWNTSRGQRSTIQQWPRLIASQH